MPCVAGGILTGYIGVAIEKVLFILFTMRLPSERVGGPPSCNPNPGLVARRPSPSSQRLRHALSFGRFFYC